MAVLSQTDIAMLGEGFYSRVSRGPKAVIDNARDLIFDAIDAVPLARGVVCALADFGAADGGTSSDLMAAAVARVRSTAPGRPVSVYYTDLPGADFATLFRSLDGERGYPAQSGDVHVFASGRSFYRQILPRASLHVGFSASAMHYLSEMPGPIEDHVHSVGASIEEQLPFRKRATADWSTILLHRAAELAPGGRLVFANFCIDEHGRYLGNTGGQNLFDTYNLLWRSLRDDGAITAAEYRGTAFQQHYKSIDDSLEPLVDEASPVRRAGLRLERAEVRTVACPFRTAYEAGELRADDFARQFVNTHRSWTETTFRAGLDSTRPPDEQDAIVAELYRRYETLVAEAPTGHGKDLVHLYIVAAKSSTHGAQRPRVEAETQGDW